MMLAKCASKRILRLSFFGCYGCFCQTKRPFGIHPIESRGATLSRDDAYYLLQECVQKKDLECGRRVQSLMLQNGLDSIAVLGDYLIRLYSSSGFLHDANKAFCQVLHPSGYTWNSFISAHANSGQGKSALELYARICHWGLKGDRRVYLALLKTSITRLELHVGRQVHQHIIESGITMDVILGTCLMGMYAKCGSLEESRKAFIKLPDRNIVSWGTIIAGCIQQGECLLALDYFLEMQETGFLPDKIVFSSILKGCCSLGAIEQGRLIHCQLLSHNLDWDVPMVNSLIDMYGKCGSLEESYKVFDKLLNRDIVSWNVLISGYAQNGESLLALNCFEEMWKIEALKPGRATFLSVLRACSDLGSIQHARFMHNEILECSLEIDVVVGSTLIDMYAKCDSLEEFVMAFEKLPNPNVVSWGAVIAGFVELGYSVFALNYFEKMQEEGIKPNEVTFFSALKACGDIAAIEYGRHIHGQILKHELEYDVAVGNTLIDMYARCASLEESYKIFERMENKSVVSWNALLAGFNQHGNDHLALDCFERMEEECIRPNKVTFLCILKLCGNLGALEWGRTIHDQIMKQGFHHDIALGNTLIDMYAKCGSLKDSREVFDKLGSRNIISWGALIEAYAQHGKVLLALDSFQKMQKNGILPDSVTFHCILVACSHVGLVDEGHWYFRYMQGAYDMMAVLDHYICMVDLLSRSGWLKEAEVLLQATGEPNVSGWKSLLSACRMHGNSDLANGCFHKLVLLDPYCASGYVLMSNIYADTGTQETIPR